MHLGSTSRTHQVVISDVRINSLSKTPSHPHRCRQQVTSVAKAGAAGPDVSRLVSTGQVRSSAPTAQPKSTAVKAIPSPAIDVPTDDTAQSSGAEVPSAGFDRGFSETYILGQPLGSGSFKTVFVGRLRSTGHRVAVQVIPKERTGISIENNIERIKQEVAVTRMLQNRPETCRLYSVFEDDRNVYLVTEMCDGGTLEQYIKTHRKMPEHDAVLVALDILNVLAECNRQQVCYADVKPANFLLKSRYPDVDSERSPSCPDAPPDIRIVDFGCSQLVKEGTKLEKRTGTPLFLPPEMFMRHWGPEADLWSLGMVTYLLLSGKMPFWGGSMGGVPPIMVMQEILGADILFDGPEWEGISEDAIDFVHKLLDRDYNTRMTAEQALQHAWIMSSYPDEMEECSLVWDDDPDYNIMTGGSKGRPRLVVQDGPVPAVACSIDNDNDSHS